MFSRPITAWTSIACAVAACSGETTSTSGDAAAGSAGSGGAGGSSGSSGRGSGASTGSGGATGSAGTAGSGSGGSAGASGSAGTAGNAGMAGRGGSAGRDGGVPDAPTSCPEGGTPDASAQDAIRASCTVAVVQVSELEEECSGLGGTHVVFTVIALGRGTAVTMLSHGGHGYFAGPDGPSAVGQYFVAGVDAFGRLAPRPVVWCVGGLPDVDGEAIALLAATSEADARAKMRDLVGP